MGLLILCISFLFSEAPSTELQLTVKEAKGTVYVAVYNSEETFMKETYKTFAATVEDRIVNLSLDLEAGTYAISVYQDLNDNDKLDTNFVGIPNEPYGFSNNAMGMFGPPSFEQSKFEIPTSTQLQINLK